MMYYKGDGVSKDYNKVIEYLTKAANNGDVKSLYNLGLLYITDKYVPQDKIKAKNYFQQAYLKKFLKACNAYEKLNN